MSTRVDQSDDRPIVVYVDDELGNRRVFEASFAPRFRVLTSPSGDEAMELVANRLGSVAVVISDQRMPGMNGVEFLERVKVFTPDVTRMMVTAFADLETAIQAVNRGQVSRYFLKPWSREEVAAAIDDALRVHHLQQRLRLVELRLVQSAGLTALGQVSAGVAHELVNAISYLGQNVESLQRELKAIDGFLTARRAEMDEKARSAHEDLPALLSDLARGAQHVRTVCDGLKGQARGQDVDRTCEVSEVASFVARLTRGQFRGKAQLRVAGEPVVVNCGPVRLTQVLVNLVTNAAQSLEGVSRQGLIGISWQELPGDLMSLRVSDNGCGVPPEFHEKVFQPMFTTKAVGVGTGLGLSICREVIRACGGDVRIWSKVGEGSEIEVLLPIVRDAQPDRSAPAASGVAGA